MVMKNNKGVAAIPSGAGATSPASRFTRISGRGRGRPRSTRSTGDHDRQGRAAEVETDVGERGRAQRRGGLMSLVNDGHQTGKSNGRARQPPSECPEVEKPEDRVAGHVAPFPETIINVEDRIGPQAGEQLENQPLGVPGGAPLAAQGQNHESPDDRRCPISE